MDPGAFFIQEYSIEIPIKKYLFQKLALDNKLKDFYSSNVESEGEFSISEGHLFTFYMNFLIKEYNYNAPNPPKKRNLYNEYFKAYQSQLRPYHNKIIYYALHERFLKFLTPVLSKIPVEIVVLCEGPISDDLPIIENITIIEIPQLFLFQNENRFLEENFSRIVQCFNTIKLFMELLKPSKILVIEGNHPQFEILAIIGRKKYIPVICIQQGWPGIFHLGFKEMQYSHFITWGDGFSNIWSQVNTRPIFISGGYPFPIIKNKERNAITFFLQAPILISSIDVYSDLVEFAFFCAVQFPERQILIREHPEYPLPPFYVKKSREYPNLKLVSPKTSDISKIFSQTLISVAIFSSTIIESIVHETIPFIFNPGLMPNYNPNLDKEGIGIEAKSFKEAKLKIVELINNNDSMKKIIENIKVKKNYYFKEGDSLTTIANLVTKIR